MTAPAQTIEQSALGRDLGASRRIVKKSESLAHVAVTARFEAEGALSDRADTDLVGQIFTAAIRPADSSKPRRGHHQRVEFARIKFLKPRVDIAAQREHTQICPVVQQLGAPAQAARAHFSPAASLASELPSRVTNTSRRQLAAPSWQRHKVGTGSLRRRAQLFRCRADLSVLALRGNIDTRLKKLNAGEFDALQLAAASFRRSDRR